LPGFFGNGITWISPFLQEFGKCSMQFDDGLVRLLTNVPFRPANTMVMRQKNYLLPMKKPVVLLFHHSSCCL